MTERRGARWWLVNAGLPAAIIATLGWLLWDRRSLFDELDDVPGDELLLVGALTVVAHFLNSAEFGLLYRSLGTRIGLVENWLVFSVGQLGNYLPGQLGTVYRFHYMKTVHDVSYGGSTAAVGLNLVISVVGTGIAGLVGCLALGVQGDGWAWPLIVGLAAMVAVAVAASRVQLPFANPADEGGGRVARAWRSIGEGWSELIAQPGVGLTVLVLELTRFAATAWRLQLTFAWLGVDEPYALFLVVGPIGALVTFIGITPAGLGLREFAIAGTVAALGSTFDEGLAGSATDRAVNVAVVALVAAAGFIFTSRRIRRATQPAT